MLAYKERRMERLIASCRANEMFLLSSFGEVDVCKTFGCGKHLTLEERRCGDRCLDHLVKEKFDIINLIKLK